VVHNRTANLLTRITDVEVVTGNFVMRRARSVLGAVAPTSGPFALYRAAVFFDNVDDYLASGTYSDDRRLTHYALLRGQVVACDEAVVEMVMPESAGQMFRQRTRWFQGYFRYLRWELVNLSGAVLLLRVWNLILLISYPLIMAFALVVLPVTAGLLYSEAWGYWLLILYAQTLHYLAGRPGLSRRSRFLAWLFLTPLVFAVQTAVVRPAMYYATTRLRLDSWGTRTA
jgi:hyaluronan synthase